ncbi:MAG TPA: hypothetical protein VFZ53_10575 [Polyangiaceae bacterium]
MSDPRRLIEEGASDFEAKLLQAGRRDAPSHRGRRRILAGLGFGGLFSTLAISTGADASMRGWLFAAGGGAASAIAVWAGVSAWSGEKTDAPAPRPAVTVVAAPHAPVPEPVQALPTPAPEPVAAPAHAPARAVRAQPERKSDGLSGEIAALEGARRALAGGKPNAALRALDEYGKSYPERRLGSEATVLRVEALLAAGERARAVRLGEDFLRSHPNGPYEKRVRSLIAE